MNSRRWRGTRGDPAVPVPDGAVPLGAPDGAAAIPVVPGFRLVRRLVLGARCEVFLAVPVKPPEAGRLGMLSDEPADPASEADVSATGPVAIKVARSRADGSEGGSEGLLREAEALSRGRHPHVLALLDIAQVSPARETGAVVSFTSASCLVLERLPRDTLAALLASRATLRPGEAITILAPIAAAVDALHRSGVAHGALSASSVLFRESGAPVLARFGSATLFSAGLPTAALDSRAEVLVDRAALSRLVDGVLARVEPALLPGGVGDREERSPGELASWLFTLATPEPIDFVPRLDALDSASPSPDARRGAQPLAATGRRETGAGERVEGRGQRVLPAPARRAVTAARQLAAAVRPGFWITAGLVALALAVAVLAIPGGSRGDEPRTASPAPKPGAIPAPTPAALSPSDGSPALGADDPVAALAALLDARAECYWQLSVRCFDGVDQAGSAARATDDASVRAVQDGGELPAGPGGRAPRIRLVQGLGDTALLRVTNWSANSEPASILIMRTEAGWRIRDYLEE